MSLHRTRLQEIRELHATAIIRRHHGSHLTNAEYDALITGIGDLLADYTNTHRRHP